MTRQQRTTSDDARPETNSNETGSDETDSPRPAPPEPEVLMEATPSVRPPLVAMLVTVLAGGLAVGYLFANPETFGDRATTEIAVNLAFILTILVVTKLAVEVYLLTRTTYVITTDAVRREYTLLYRTFSRELPISRLRSHELERRRVEALFGIGTVSFLTGSVARSPAHVAFEHVSDPEAVRNLVRDRLSLLDR